NSLFNGENHGALICLGRTNVKLHHDGVMYLIGIFWCTFSYGLDIRECETKLSYPRKEYRYYHVTMKLMKKQEVMNEAYITITGLGAYHPTQYSTSDEFLRGRVELTR
ncbi:11927_t:CDS:2, partial [Funneliformis mosseae]